MSSLPQHQPEYNQARWVTEEALGVTSRRARDLFKRYQKLGAAKLFGKTKVFDTHNPEIASRVRKAKEDQSYEDLTGLSDKQIAAARKKIALVEKSFTEIASRMKQTGCTFTVAREWFCETRLPQLGMEAVAVRSFRRWENIYRNASNNRIRAFIDTRGRKKGEKLACSPEAWNWFLGYYLDKRKPSIRYCWELTVVEAETRGWAWPGCRAIEKKVDRDIPQQVIIKLREGDKKYQEKCVTPIRRDYTIFAANDFWCADEHTLDLYAKRPNGLGGWKKCRPILTAWQDMRSRYFVGWHLSARANSDTIISAFKMGVREFGPPRRVYCDNGTDYNAAAGVTKKTKRSKVNQDYVANVYGEMNIQVTWATPYHPQAKPIESHFRKVCSRFAKTFTSYCGNKPDNRPDDVEIRIEHLPTVNEVAERFSEWVKAYHAKPQSGDGMDDLAPEQAIVRFRSTTVRERISDEKLDFLCVRTTKPVVVSKDGVRHNGLYYGISNMEVMKHLGRKVLLKVQPDTAEYVTVCDLDGKPIANARHEWLRGTTQEDIRTAKSLQKKMNKIVSEFAKLPPAYKQNDTIDVLKAQLARAKSEQNPVGPPDPVLAIQPVRPDLSNSIADLHKSEEQKAVERNVPEIPMIDFRQINQDLAKDSPVVIDDGDDPDSDVIDISDVIFSNSASSMPDDLPDDLPDLFEVLAQRNERRDSGIQRRSG